MTADIIDLPCWTSHDLPVDRVLDGVKESGYEHVIVIGLDEDGELQLHASMADLTRIFRDLHMVALKIIQGDYGRLSNGEGK